LCHNDELIANGGCVECDICGGIQGVTSHCGYVENLEYTL